MEDSIKKVEEEVERVVEEAKELQESATTLINKTSSDEQSLRHRALSLDSDIHRLRSLLHSNSKSSLFYSKLADKLEEDLQKSQCLIYDGDASAFLPIKAQGIYTAINYLIGSLVAESTQGGVKGSYPITSQQ